MNPQARFEALYRVHADRVHSYARRRSDVSTADDVVAEVFVVVWRRLDEVPDQPLGWLLGVARRVLANRRRAADRAAALHERLASSTPRSQAPPAIADERVSKALADLSEQDRELLLLNVWEGLGQAELAGALGVRRGTIAVRLHRARQRFALALAAQDEDSMTPAEVRR